MEVIKTYIVHANRYGRTYIEKLYLCESNIWMLEKNIYEYGSGRLSLEEIEETEARKLIKSTMEYILNLQKRNENN